MKRLLVGIGELLWDLLPTGRELGGAPANFAYHVTSLGGEGVVVSCVGSDEEGQQIADRLHTLSLSCEYIAIDQIHPTGAASVEIDVEGKPSYIIHEDVAWDFIPRTPELAKLARRADAVCFGTLAQRTIVSRATIRGFLEGTSGNALRIFDINLRQSFYSRDVIEESLQLANVLKLSDEELMVVRDLLSLCGDAPMILRELSRRYNLRLIAVTRGEGGSILYSGEETSIHPGHQTEVVDTVGAGDSFTAALAMGVLRGQSLDSINSNASRVAAYVCSRPGATPELPDELRNVVKSVDRV